MKTLLLARHGIAEERHKGGNDFDRKLTGAGKRESAFAGKRLRKMNVIPEIIISSPAPRALRTAEIISDKIKFRKDKISPEKILYTGDVQQVLKILSQISGAQKVVMLCGHNPLLEEISASFCGGKVREIHKGDITGISFATDDWKNIKKKTGKYIFTITENNSARAGQNQLNMKTNKTKNQKKELQAQVSELIHAFAKSKAKIGSKKIRKSVKEASKLVAKAIYKTLLEQPKAKKQTAKKITVKRKTVKKVAGIKAKPVVKKNAVKKPARAKGVSKNILPSMNNVGKKVSVVESNPLHV